jgi:hypothetical protein
LYRNRKLSLNYDPAEYDDAGFFFYSMTEC